MTVIINAFRNAHQEGSEPKFCHWYLNLTFGNLETKNNCVSLVFNPWIHIYSSHLILKYDTIE